MLAPYNYFDGDPVDHECERPHQRTGTASHKAPKEMCFADHSRGLFQPPSRYLGEVPDSEERCWPMCRSEARTVAGLTLCR